VNRRQATPDLFKTAPPTSTFEAIGPGAAVLRGYALDDACWLRAALDDILREAPWRRLLTPGGRPFSVEMTNCGLRGWISDHAGYRYSDVDPVTGQHWPTMPAAWFLLAQRAASAAGYAGFEPDACLVNRYAPGASMGLHQDRDERDATAPIVSVSLGLPAIFLFGGPRRADRAARVPLEHGDIVVWGGPSRLTFHGVARVPTGTHDFAGRCRINLTFRRAG
jgi:alkylated DNA repair protein (DNA oxidative demethylase)